MPHLILTRLMIGVSRPMAFVQHAKVLIETTYRSLAAQTEQGFVWVVVTDEMIAPKAKALIEESFAAHPNFHLETVDPFQPGAHFPLLVATLCEKYLGTFENVLTTRIDDDDALRVDFIADAQAAIAASDVPLTSFSYLNGVLVASEFKRHMVVFSRGGASAGMTLRSPDVRQVHVHSWGHNKLHATVEARGGKAIHRDDPEPHFLTGTHLTSDSRERSGRARTQRKIAQRFVDSDPADPAYAALLASFGLRRDFDERITRIRERFVDPRPPIFAESPGSEKPFSRLGLKRQYFEWANRLREQREGASPEEQARIDLQVHLLKQAYYVI